MTKKSKQDDPRRVLCETPGHRSTQGRPWSTATIERESARSGAIGCAWDYAWKVAGQLAKHGSVQRGYLGIRSQDVELSAAVQESLKREQSAGLLVVSVEKDSPAEAGGLIVGDILAGIDGQPVEDHDALFARLSGEAVGKSMPVEILRGGQPQTLKVKIGARS